MTHDQLAQATDHYRQAEQSLKEARYRLFEAIIDAQNAGSRQVDICRTTGLTREHIRRITARHTP